MMNEDDVRGGFLELGCNARKPARSLYARAGFHVTSEEFELPHIGPTTRWSSRWRPAGRYGIRTRLMTWMTPFDALTSVFVTCAWLT